MNRTKYLFLMLVILTACRKPKITIETLKGNWIYTEYTSYLRNDSTNQYSSKIIKESGFLRLDGSMSISNEEKIIGRAKLPYLYTESPLSWYYNNGNPYNYEDDIYLDLNNINHKRRGNYRNFLQTSIHFINPSNPLMNNGGNTIEIVQNSKKELTLKLFGTQEFGDTIHLEYSILKLKKQ